MSGQYEQTSRALRFLKGSLETFSCMEPRIGGFVHNREFRFGFSFFWFSDWIHFFDVLFLMVHVSVSIVFKKIYNKFRINSSDPDPSLGGGGGGGSGWFIACILHS